MWTRSLWRCAPRGCWASGRAQRIRAHLAGCPRVCRRAGPAVRGPGAAGPGAPPFPAASDRRPAGRRAERRGRPPRRAGSRSRTGPGGGPRTGAGRARRGPRRLSLARGGRRGAGCGSRSPPGYWPWPLCSSWRAGRLRGDPVLPVPLDLVLGRAAHGRRGGAQPGPQPPSRAEPRVPFGTAFTVIASGTRYNPHTFAAQAARVLAGSTPGGSRPGEPAGPAGPVPALRPDADRVRDQGAGCRPRQ